MSKPSMKQICRKTAYGIFVALVEDHWGGNGGLTLAEDQIDPFFNHHFQYANQFWGVKLSNKHKTKIYEMVLGFLEIMEEHQVHPEDREELEARLDELDVEEETEEAEEDGSSEDSGSDQQDELGGVSSLSEEETSIVSKTDCSEGSSGEVEKPPQKAV